MIELITNLGGSSMMGNFGSWYSGNMMGNGFYGPLILVAVWSLFWKGMALWRAAKEDSKPWFVALLVVNTIGILEIAYLFFFAKEKLTLSTLSWSRTTKSKSKKK